MKKPTYIVLSCSLMLVGCSFPKWTIGQAKVPAPITKNNSQLEAERRAALLIADRLESPPELIPVAKSLSESLGVPEKPIKEPDIAKASDQAINDLRNEMVALRRLVEKQNRLLSSLEGKKIEDTGFNLFGPSMSFLVIALIVLGVIFPPIATILFFVMRRLWATGKMLVDQIEQASSSDTITDLKNKLSVKMDKAHKRTVNNLKHT